MNYQLFVGNVQGGIFISQNGTATLVGCLAYCSTEPTCAGVDFNVRHSLCFSFSDAIFDVNPSLSNVFHLVKLCLTDDPTSFSLNESPTYMPFAYSSTIESTTIPSIKIAFGTESDARKLYMIFVRTNTITIT